MVTWFYAVLVEDAGWYSTAVRARSIQNARRTLARRYPHARIQDIHA